MLRVSLLRVTLQLVDEDCVCVLSLNFLIKECLWELIWWSVGGSCEKDSCVVCEKGQR